MTPENEQRLFTTLGRIEQKIDSHLTEDADVHQRHDRAINDTIGRVTTVEKTQARHRGIAMGITGVFASVLALFKYHGG
jgi:hypothetical protein